MPVPRPPPHTGSIRLSGWDPAAVYFNASVRPQLQTTAPKVFLTFMPLSRFLDLKCLRMWPLGSIREEHYVVCHDKL